MAKPKKESARMIKAFEFYYKMGVGRTLVKVARKFQKSEQSVVKWSTAFKWVSRCSEMDRNVTNQALESFDNLLIKAKEENLKIIRAVKINLAEELKRMQASGKTFKVTLNDFEKLAKLELLILGDPTERISDDTITGLVKSAAESRRKRINSNRD